MALFNSRIATITLAVLGSSILLTSVSEAGLFGKRRNTPRPTPPPANRFPLDSENPYANPGARSLSSEPSLFPTGASETSVPQLVSFQRPTYTEPSYSLPFSDYNFTRKEGKPRSFFGSPKPSEEVFQLIAVIRARAEALSRYGLVYKFGGDHPTEGGMDCSGTMKYLLGDIGFTDMPRTSYQQYDWTRKHRTLKHSKSIPDRMGGRKGIKPGDLIFWGGTYNSGHKVSHVMVYLGQSGEGTHYMFGARGKKKKGLNGSGVDIFKLESGYQKSLVGFASLPGVY